MDNKFLLSICIPTYNRATHLKECLDNIICQFDEAVVKNLVEVVISDNASEDNTQELAQWYQQRFDNIKYFKNQKNIGMDENIINSVLKASGKYCWHIGDDDLIQNGALRLIIKILEKRNPSLLSLNFHPFVDIQKSRERKNFTEDNYIKDSETPEEFYLKGYCQGILGIFIFNKEHWTKIDRKGYEKHWGYYEIILKMAGSAPSPLIYLDLPVLFTGQDYRWNEGGTALSILIHSKKFLTKLKEYGYSKKFIKKETNRIARTMFKTILSAKSYNLKCSLKNLSLIYKEFYKYPLHLFLITLFFFIPNQFIKIAKNIKNKLSQKNV